VLGLEKRENGLVVKTRLIFIDFFKRNFKTFWQKEIENPF
jgi:hypothetical protein